MAQSRESSADIPTAHEEVLISSENLASALEFVNNARTVNVGMEIPMSTSVEQNNIRSPHSHPPNAQLPAVTLLTFETVPKSFKGTLLFTFATSLLIFSFYLFIICLVNLFTRSIDVFLSAKIYAIVVTLLFPYLTLRWYYGAQTESFVVALDRSNQARPKIRAGLQVKKNIFNSNCRPEPELLVPSFYGENCSVKVENSSCCFGKEHCESVVITNKCFVYEKRTVFGTVKSRRFPTICFTPRNIDNFLSLCETLNIPVERIKKNTMHVSMSHTGTDDSDSNTLYQRMDVNHV
mmetsp:Transcript_7282/g.9226  ORF Transcript_7282/g.9226 Transcript_7282/m.9226 type:complete len:293 (+) Transcript_7282:534-1412(+)